MVLQEKPYWQKEDDDNDSEPDTRPASHGYGPYGEPPRVERSAPEPIPEVRHHIPAAPLEGVISWRQNEDAIQRTKSERSHEDDDDDDDEDETPATHATTLRPAAKPTEQPAEHHEGAVAEHPTEITEATESVADELTPHTEHTLVAEQAHDVPASAVAEAQARQEKAPDDDEDEAEDTDSTPPPHTAKRSESTPATPMHPWEAVRSAVPQSLEETGADAAAYQDIPHYQTPSSTAPPRFQAAPTERPAPQAEPAATFETPVPAMAQPEAQPGENPAEAEPVYAGYSDVDIPPPHVGVTEAADYRPTPPLPPMEVGDVPPPPPDQTSFQYGQTPGMYPPTYAQQPAGAAAAPRIEQAPVDNHRHGEPLAVAVGLGLVAEHIGRKRADTRQQNQIDRFTEQSTQYQQENNAQQTRMQEQQRRFANEQQRQTEEMQRMHQQQQSQQERYAAAATPYNLEYAPEPTREQTANTQPVSPNAQPQAARQAEAAPAGNPLHRQYGGERMPYQQQPKQQEAAPLTPGQPGNAERQPDQQVAEQQEYLNEVQQQPKQHVEQSAWHRIVTEHGHEVQGAVQYGQEFHRQREHELLTDKSTANPTDAAGAGAQGGAGAPLGQFPGQPMPGTPYQHPTQPGALPSGMTNPTLPPGHPTHIDPQHQLPAAPQKQVASNIANPWFWIMLILIVAAFFTAALV